MHSEGDLVTSLVILMDIFVGILTDLMRLLESMT